VRRLKVAAPLPECRLCDRPTARAVWLANGGLCSECDEGVSGVAATVRMARLPPAPDQFLSDSTVLVEGFRPPVPGQLRIDEENEQ
jgi:hypothetical protein